ncbi:hypothetical protein HaLaN_17341 [Haematococcus lacustris]|uniref:Uncharacterized protein n=1 Tax=Haematococcus lacustris TaxID=44745 RepID=A0A699ZDQ0_HAELA|nr:hypothetical protein HaLaN_17341 [Haematococcus lacustris]
MTDVGSYPCYPPPTPAPRRVTTVAGDISGGSGTPSGGLATAAVFSDIKLMTHVASTGNLYLVHGNPGTLFKLDNAPTFNLAQLATLSATPALASASGNLYLVHGNPGTLFKLDNAPTFNLAQLATLSATPALASSSGQALANRPDWLDQQQGSSGSTMHSTPQPLQTLADEVSFQ